MSREYNSDPDRYSPEVLRGMDATAARRLDQMRPLGSTPAPSTAQHSPTPGPWRVEDDIELTGKQYRHIVPAGFIPLAYVPRHKPDRPEDIANARLIAASPQLLDALQIIEQLVHRIGAVGYDSQYVGKQIGIEARAAILAAGGRADG